MTLFWGICGAVVAYIVIKKFFPDDVRDCPHCYSKIPKKATVCKHCKTKVEKYKVDKKSSSADKLELVEELSEITGAKQSDSLSAFEGPKNDPLYGRVRKLSMTVLLNENYKGGRFEFSHQENGESIITQPEFFKTGSVIVFPSFMEHRVTPVTHGARYSLVVWFLGPAFR